MERKSGVTRKYRPKVRIRIAGVRYEGQQQGHHHKERVLRLKAVHQRLVLHDTASLTHRRSTRKNLRPNSRILREDDDPVMKT